MRGSCSELNSGISGKGNNSSLTPDKLMTPDFKVCTQNYRVETEPKWSVGHTDEWAYKTREEEDIDNSYDGFEKDT